MANLSRLFRKIMFSFILVLFITVPTVSASVLYNDVCENGRFIEYYIFNIKGLRGEYKFYSEEPFVAKIKYEFENDWRDVSLPDEIALYYELKKEAKK